MKEGSICVLMRRAISARHYLLLLLLLLRQWLLLVAPPRGGGRFPLGPVPGGESKREMRRSERIASWMRLHRVPAVLLPAVLLPAVVGKGHTHEHNRHAGPARDCLPRHPTPRLQPPCHPSEPLLFKSHGIL
jgi:hypothetical protein